MALFTDGISTIQDLLSQDSSLLTTAQTEQIDLTQKLANAQQELGISLTTLLQQSLTYDWQFWLQPNPQLNNIVVTAPLQLWHVFKTLELVYRDAYFNQLNDRYGGKRDQFQQSAKWAAEKLIQTGVGVVSDPLRVAAAPRLTAVAGSGPAATYYANASWINAEGEEGQPGSPSFLAVAEANVLVVQPVNPPSNATGWNVYAGLAPETLILQNNTPMAMDQAWVQSGTLLTTGTAPGSGQAPNYLRPLPRLIQRG